jgi:hypothetical protein
MEFLSTSVERKKFLFFEKEEIVPPQCRFYQKGYCMHGDECKFTHSFEKFIKFKTNLKYKLKCIQGELYEETLIRRVLENHGFKMSKDLSECNLFWNKTDLNEIEMKVLNRKCKVLHFPLITELSHKSRLVENFNGKDFLPESFAFPKDLEKFKNRKEREDDLWIIKPKRAGKGIGIYLKKKLTDKELNSYDIVVSKYISNPLLLSKKKFDFRVYILILSLDPLDVYLYEDGLVRFAADDYVNDNFDNNFIHITNNSLNFKKEGLNTFEQNITLTKLKKEFELNGLDFSVVKKQIENIVKECVIKVSKTILNAYSKYPEKFECFDLLGMDLLIDSDLKVWLLEVNSTPDMTGSSRKCWDIHETDFHLKSNILADLFNILGFEVEDENVKSVDIEDRSVLGSFKRLNF